MVRTVEHDGFGQAAHRRLAGHHLVEQGRISHQREAFAVDVAGHGHGVAADDLLMFLEIGVGDGQALVEHGPDPAGEPLLDADIDQDARQQGDQNRRQDGDDREHHHQPHMQLGARHAGPALGPDGGDAPPDQRHQRQDQQEIQHHQREDGARIGPVQRPGAGQGREGRGAGHEYGDGKRQLEPPGQIGLAAPTVQSDNESVHKQDALSGAPEIKLISETKVSFTSACAPPRAPASVGRARPRCRVRGSSCAACCGSGPAAPPP